MYREPIAERLVRYLVIAVVFPIVGCLGLMGLPLLLIPHRDPGAT